MAAGDHDPIGLTFKPGASYCYLDDGQCGYEEFEIAVQAPDGSAVSIVTDEIAKVGELMVTNDRYFESYDTSGACNFGVPVDFFVGAARIHETP